MPKHISRLLLLMAAFVVAALAAKAFFTVNSFYRYGHYRADSVPEIAAMAPSFQTPKACASCHAPRLAEWTAGHHKTVICEVCHGALPGHPEALKATIPTDTVSLCTQCHEKMPGRPDSIRQVDVSQHHPSGQCISCHNPHAPKIGTAIPVTPAALHAAASNAAACAACHGANGMATSDIWPNLAGQNAAYIARSLGAFKTGGRVEPTMSPMAQAVADEDVPALAAYFAAMSCRTPTGKHGSGNAAAGKTLAKQCAACHGENGRPVNSAWPRLSGQNAAYLVSAITAFRDGQRKNPFMSEAARGLGDNDIANLASYFAGLPCGIETH